MMVFLESRELYSRAGADLKQTTRKIRALRMLRTDLGICSALAGFDSPSARPLPQVIG